MKKLDYYVLDVFTDEKYKGNQLSVVHSEEELTLKQYHDITREFGFSETSFVRYSEKEKFFVVRSFTVAGFEVVGAGHNLLGAVCLALIKEWNIFRSQTPPYTVLIKDMQIPVTVSETQGLRYVGMKQRSAKQLKTVPANVIAVAIGLTPDDLDLNSWEVKVVKTEVAHLMVPIKKLSVLQNAIPNKTLLKAASKEYQFEGCYLFTTNQPDTNLLAETRFFNPGLGIDEDPATGTAAGPLAGYLHQLKYIKQDQDYTILQGTAVKHPSKIKVKATSDGVWVGGSSVVVMEGVLYL